MSIKEIIYSYPHSGGLIGIPYDLLADPRPLTEIGRPCAETNCRRAIQEFYGHFGIFLPAESCLSEQAYLGFGNPQPVWDEGGKGGEPFVRARFGDLIIAESRQGNGENGFSREQKLHLSVYLGQAGSSLVRAVFPEESAGFPSGMELVFHATNRGLTVGIEAERVGRSVVWTVSEFAKVYAPVRLRRLDVLATALDQNIII